MKFRTARRSSRADRELAKYRTRARLAKQDATRRQLVLEKTVKGLGEELKRKAAVSIVIDHSPPYGRMMVAQVAFYPDDLSRFLCRRAAESDRATNIEDGAYLIGREVAAKVSRAIVEVTREKFPYLNGACP